MWNGKKSKAVTSTIEAQAANTGIVERAVTNLYDTFMLNRTLVFQINIMLKHLALW